MSVLTLIQARLDSERLPNKMLMDIPQGSGITMLERVIARVKKSNTTYICVVTPDKKLAKIAQKCGVDFNIHKTKDHNVLEEFWVAAQKFKEADYIVRITGDCPCVSPAIIDRLINTISGQFLMSYGSDYLGFNRVLDGLDVEIFHRSLLEETHEKATDPCDKEHITIYMYRNCNCFLFASPYDFSGIKDVVISVNNQEQYERVCNIYKALGSDFETQMLIGYLKANNQKKDCCGQRAGSFLPSWVYGDSQRAQAQRQAQESSYFGIAPYQLGSLIYGNNK
jgi:spore coat polysaccharide biosynthesis protein SpsF (cytidylyltransferase family)